MAKLPERDSAARAPEALKLLAHDVRWRLLQALAQSDLRVQEMTALVGEPQNLVSYHLRQMRELQVVEEHRSSADGRDVYYALDLPRLQSLFTQAASQLHPALLDAELLAARPTSSDAFARYAPAAPATGSDVDTQRGAAVRVLFLCTHNSARSQMAEGILRHLAPQYEVYSAGNDPQAVQPLAVSALAAMGIDISQQRAKHVDEFRGQTFSYVITLCDIAREACPTFPGSPTEMHWSIPDPVAVAEPDGARKRAFVQTAQRLSTRIRYLLPLIQQRQLGAN